MHLSLRRLLYDCSIASKIVEAISGVLAGSPHATYEVAAYLVAALRLYHHLYPRITLRARVDDTAGYTSEASRFEAIKQAIEGFEGVFRALEHLALSADLDETLALASATDVAQAAAWISRSQGRFANVESGLCALGYQHALDFRRRPKVFIFQTRVRNALRRAPALRRVVN